MIKPKLRSPRKIKALALCEELVGQDFNLAEKIAKPLDLAPSSAAKALRDLRADGYLKYTALPDMSGAYVWHIYGAERFDLAEAQPFLPF